MALIDVDKWDKKLWAPKALGQAGPSIWPSSFRESWRDVLRDQRPVLIRLLITISFYGLISLAIGIFFAAAAVGVTMSHDYKYSWIGLVALVMIATSISFFKDVYRLFFYLFISKRKIEDYLEKEARAVR